MATDPSFWPLKPTREQARLAKERRRDFEAVLKARARAAKWRFAGGTIFREAEGWFVSNMPMLRWERGVSANLSIKPMRLDPIFWQIAGLPENDRLPLSFRVNGAWTLRPPWIEQNLAPDEERIEHLAQAVLDWTEAQVREGVGRWSTAWMLARLPDGPALAGQQLALAICLHLLDGDLDGASRLCRQDAPGLTGGAGFATLGSGGFTTFTDQARDWIAARRRGRIGLVG